MKMLKKMKKDVEAVSPVVATLMLVLVAVGMSAALYVFLNSYQKGVQGQVGDVGVQSSITCGGSTTMTDLMNEFASLYMKNNTNIKVTVQTGGSGAGKSSAASGAVDIGLSSAALTASEKQQYPNLVQTCVALDGVCIVVPTGAAHNLVSMNATVLLKIYQANGGYASFSAPSWMPVGGDGKYQWNEIPARAGSITWMCNGTQTVAVMDRLDNSGTEEKFVNMLGQGNKQLEDIGISGCAHYSGNPALIAAIAANPDAISFTSFGFITATGGVVQLPGGFQAAAATAGSAPTVPQTATSSNIYSLTYAGARPLMVLTNGAPTGSAKAFIDYCLSPQVNTFACGICGYLTVDSTSYIGYGS